MGEILYRGDDYKEKLDTTREKVEDILARKEQARNSDDFLIWYFWKYQEDIDLNDFSEFKDATSPETIRRVRQEIQNDELKYLPTDPKVLKKRRFKEREIREYYSDDEVRDIFDSFN